MSSQRTLAILKGLGGCGAVLGLSLLSGCGGQGTVQGVHEYMYVATGTTVAEYVMQPTGQLTALSTPATSATGAVSVTVAPNSKWFYAVNSGGTVSQYSIGSSGVLSPLGHPTTQVGSGPRALAVNPFTTFAYVLNSADGTISQFSVAVNGELVALTTPTVPTDTGGNGLTITPNGKFLYATSYTAGNIDAYAIGTDGTLTPLTVPTYNVGALNQALVSPDGQHMYVPSSGNGIAEFTINSDGSLTPLSPAFIATPGDGQDAVCETPNETFLYAGCFNGGFPGSPIGQYSVNGDGTATALNPASVPAGNAPQFLIADPMGRFVYCANGNDGTVSQFSIGADGTLAALSPDTVNPGGALWLAIARR